MDARLVIINNNSDQLRNVDASGNRIQTTLDLPGTYTGETPPVITRASTAGVPLDALGNPLAETLQSGDVPFNAQGIKNANEVLESGERIQLIQRAREAPDI